MDDHADMLIYKCCYDRVQSAFYKVERNDHEDRECIQVCNCRIDLCSHCDDVLDSAESNFCVERKCDRAVYEYSADDSTDDTGSESDHSGALPVLMREIPDTPIYCTKKAEGILRGLYHKDWNFHNVKTGDTLCIGENTLTFVEAPMCHWPDTMVTYADKEEILFSNDVFGQHYATESLYDDTVNQKDLFDEAEKYYANILNIYNPMVNRKVKEIVGMNLPLKMVAPSHGVIWTNHIGEIVEKYLQWSTNYQEHQITIIYDTMWQSTRRMAQAIADGIRDFDPTVRVVLMNAAKDDKNDILVEVFRSKAIMVGSPTVNMGITYAIAGLLEMIHGMKCKNKKAAAFGSIGWGGGGEKRIQQRLEEAGFEIAAEPGKQLWAPDMEAERKWREYGKAFAAAVLGA